MNMVLDMPLDARVNVDVFLTDLTPAEFRVFAKSKGTPARYHHATLIAGEWVSCLCAKWEEGGARCYAFGPPDVAVSREEPK